MKKRLPVIIILISLSLIGLILLQKSWFTNVLQVTTSQLNDRFVQVVNDVSADLGKTAYSSQLQLPRRGSLTFTPDFHLHPLRPPIVAEKFSTQDVHAKLQSAFNNAGFRNIPFQFGVIKGYDDAELETRDFLKQVDDTVNYSRVYATVVPEHIEEWEIGSITQETLVVLVPNLRKQALRSLQWVFLIAVLFTVIIMAAFFVTVKSLLDQRKLSEIKSDFINNMTHEFKTPLATISLAVDALRNERVRGDKEKAKYFSDIIKEENIRMNKHVETILQAALMERQQLQLNLLPLHAHEVMRDVLDNYELQLKEKQGEIIVHLNALNDLIRADEVHFSNMISNLVDNAIKYSKENPRIIVSTHCIKKYLVIRVEDNGIGMSKETVKRVFEKFYRAHTGNLHDVKGFGLGMSYVKTVIDAHKGKVKVESTLGKGSAFVVEMPLKEDA